MDEFVRKAAALGLPAIMLLIVFATHLFLNANAQDISVG